MEKMQLLLSLIEGTNDLIHSVEPDGKFEFVNRAWIETLGYSDKDVGGLRLKDILFPGHLGTHQKLVSRVLKGESETGVEVVFVTKDGRTVNVEGNLFPRKEGGKIISATGFFRDITSRVQTEKRLEESKARTEFFVDLMVHDLMNINQEILSTFEILLLSKDLPSQLGGLIRESLAELERASSLVGNVRKITQLHAKVPEATEWDLKEVISSAAKSADETFPDKKLHLQTDLAPGQYMVIADEFLEDVFLSLLHNSMKFDKSQDVQIEIDVEPIKHTPFLRIEIKDYGPGIPDEEKEMVFDKLSHRRESIMGLGLGLTLVKTVLDNYGAFIRVEDRVEGDHTKGANFVILMRHAGVNRLGREGDK
ncbi:MAG: PAS domain S-box protein [Candidatus Thorarchaeota archaeon]